MMEEFDDQKPMRGLDEYWAMVVRRRWWILGPLFLGWLIVFASAWIIPPKYTSETVILVEQQKVPTTVRAVERAGGPGRASAIHHAAGAEPRDDC